MKQSTMTKVTKHGIILDKTELGFEHDGVLNPAAIRDGDGVHLFYRAVAKGNYSSIGHCWLDGPTGRVDRGVLPVLFPQFEYESGGVEDPRIVKIDDIYYLSYTAYDGVNALGALATSTDLVNFEKKGIITPHVIYNDFKRLAESVVPLNEKYARYNDRNRRAPVGDKTLTLWDKNVMFFPRKINGQFVFLHRIKPDIQIAMVNNIADLTKEFWENWFLHFAENIVLAPLHPHEVSYLGGGCPPIETAEGWLVIYHGVYDTTTGYVYSACAALLDLNDPHKEIARLPKPLFKPELDWELVGEVNNVCFPSGAVVFDDTIYIYYGAADSRIACASVSLSGLLAELLSTTEPRSVACPDS